MTATLEQIRVKATRRTVLMVQTRFVPLILGRGKRQTIRLLRKRPIQVGDILSLREWTARPYRSKQRVLCEAVVSRVRPIRLDCYNGEVDGVWFNTKQDQNAFARADGFRDWAEMSAWFQETHGSDQFQGVLIEWNFL